MLQELIDGRQRRGIFRDLDNDCVAIAINPVNVHKPGRYFLLEIQDLETWLNDIRLKNDGSLHLLLARVKDKLRVILEEKSTKKLDIAHNEGQTFERSRTNSFYNKSTIVSMGLNDTS